MKYKGIELPDNLQHIADVYIKNVIDEQEKNEKLNTLDHALYYMLASQYQTYLEAKEIEKQQGITTVSPTGLISVAAWVKISKDCLVAINQISQQLGLSPKARKSIEVLTQQAPEESPLSKFLSQNEEY